MKSRDNAEGAGEGVEVGVKEVIEAAVGVVAFHLELMHCRPNEDAIAAAGNRQRQDNEGMLSVASLPGESSWCYRAESVFSATDDNDSSHEVPKLECRALTQGAKREQRQRGCKMVN